MLPRIGRGIRLGMFGRDYPPRPYFQIKKSAISIFSLVPGLLYPHQTNFAWFENPLLYVVEEFEKACISAEVKKLQKSPKNIFFILVFHFDSCWKLISYVYTLAWFSWKLYLILNQNGKNVHRPVFVPERLKNHVLGDTIYLYNLFIGVPFSTITQIKR